MNRGDDNYWGRFTVSPGLGRVSTVGSQNIMLRAIDKKAARVSNFQLPAEAFGSLDIEQVVHADAWREGETLEVDLKLKTGKVVKLSVRR